MIFTDTWRKTFFEIVEEMNKGIFFKAGLNIPVPR